jgi:hypothetical protein
MVNQYNWPRFGVEPRTSKDVSFAPEGKYGGICSFRSAAFVVMVMKCAFCSYNLFLEKMNPGK